MVTDARLVILLVDDSKLIIEKMIGMLHDHENIRIVVQAGSYTEAADVIREIEPDIVMMEIVLRDKIGTGLLGFIQKNYPDSIETVVLTNNVGQHYEDICKKLGASHFLDKSNDIEMILKVINDKYENNKKMYTERLPPIH
jgi:DNA-binding NarL/FixJ family response regulator